MTNVKRRYLTAHRSIEMQNRKHNYIPFVLAVLLIAQTVFPLAAQAEVTMVCKGPRAAAAVCGRVIVPISDVDSGKAYAALMPCCAMKHMDRGSGTSCGMMTRSSYVSRSTRGQMAIHGKKTCTLVVTSIPTDGLAALQAQHRLIVGSHQVLCNPTFSSISSIYPLLTITVSPETVGRALAPPVTSHGLRAPPVA